MDKLNHWKLLVIDDNVDQAEFYAAMLRQKKFDVVAGFNLAHMKRELAKCDFHAVLLDLQLGNEDGLEGLDFILSQFPQTKVFILSAHGSIDRAVEAMRKGASGFFEKGCGIEHLHSEISTALHIESHITSDVHFDLGKLGLIGESEQLQQVVAKIYKLSQFDPTVLIMGESGTGKEVIARAIHKTSKRSKNRFAAINCGAIPENLLESELFGHRKGSFTDAKVDRKGIFEVTSTGSLLLDEIGDMPPPLQTKLLRVLQEREITPVGSNESIKIDTRIIAATHRDIRQEASEKRFREDLYYRLSIIVLKIPSLRERIEDIPLLLKHFLGIFNERFSKNVVMPIGYDLKRILAYSWPGNIRELQNAVERSVVLSSNDHLDLEDLFAGVIDIAQPHLEQPTAVNHSSSRVQEHSLEAAELPPQNADMSEAVFQKNQSRSVEETGLYNIPLTEAKSMFEKRYLEYQVAAHSGNIHDLAEKSGRYRADIYRLLSRHGIDHTLYKD